MRSSLTVLRFVVVGVAVLTKVDLMIDTIDSVSAMKHVFCESILTARWKQMGSLNVAAHTSGTIRFSVRQVIVHEMTVRCVWASAQATDTRAYTVWRR